MQSTLAPLPLAPPEIENWSPVARLTGRWFVAQTASREEKSLAADLTRRGIDHYLPTFDVPGRSGRQRYVSQVAVFPGYLFLNGDEYTPAAAKAGGRTFHVIDVKDQDRIRRDLINLELALSLNPRAELFNGVVPGATCRIATGPFEGLEGKVLQKPNGMMMVALEVHMMSRPVVLEIDAADVEPVGD